MCRKNGFTFIELLITLAIMSIIASIAYPSYMGYLTRARRLDGQTALLHLANQMEQYYYRHQTYKTATIAHGEDNDILNTNTSSEGWYTLAILEQTENTYLLEASAIKTQAQQDKACYHLTLNQLGEKGPDETLQESTKPTFVHCW